MVTILVISVIIIAVVLILSVFTTSKAYTYKHTVDPIDENLRENHHQSELEKESEKGFLK